MVFQQLKLEGVYLLETESLKDNRGEFGRLLCKNEMAKNGLVADLVQINHSKNINVGCIRGMHYQKPPRSEVKIIKCIKGAVYDVIVDLRKSSPTFLQHSSLELTEENSHMLYIPHGFAHGFQVLEENTELIYMHSEYYSPEFEGALNFGDPKLNIEWPLSVTQVSEKDKEHPFIDERFKGLNI